MQPRRRNAFASTNQKTAEFGCMAQQLGISGQPSSPGRFADAFVIFSVTVLSMALGAWFLLQLGLSLWPGMAAALTVYTVLLLFHLLVRRSLIDAGAEEPREEMQWIAGEPDLAPPASDRRERSSRPPSFAADGERSDQPPSALDDPHTLPDPSTEIAFHYRPRDPAGSLGGMRVAPRAAADPVPPRGAGEAWPGTPPPSPSEKNVELIQDLIKKLADELSDVPMPAAQPTAPAGELEDAMIARSLAALDTAAASMRAAAAEPAAAAGGGWWPGAAAPSELGPEPAPSRPPRASAAAAPPVPNAQVARAAEGRGDRGQSHGNPA